MKENKMQERMLRATYYLSDAAANCLGFNLNRVISLSCSSHTEYLVEIHVSSEAFDLLAGSGSEIVEHCAHIRNMEGYADDDKYYFAVADGVQVFCLRDIEKEEK